MGAYAWLAFFISLFVISFIWYFTAEPLLNYCLKVAYVNNYTEHLPPTSYFYNFLEIIIILFPIIIIILLMIGYLVESQV